MRWYARPCISYFEADDRFRNPPLSQTINRERKSRSHGCLIRPAGAPTTKSSPKSPCSKCSELARGRKQMSLCSRPSFFLVCSVPIKLRQETSMCDLGRLREEHERAAGCPRGLFRVSRGDAHVKQWLDSKSCFTTSHGSGQMAKRTFVFFFLFPFSLPSRGGTS